MKYEVLARVKAGDETIVVGTVDAPNDRLARAYARTTYDEEDWDYLAVVAREDVVEVPEEGQVPDAARSDAAGGGR
jgi:1,2-phenylacetyl-CoA epoxidase PaaB subunit